MYAWLCTGSHIDHIFTGKTCSTRKQGDYHIPKVYINWCELFCLQKQSEQLITTFEAPLKEFVRAVKSAKSVMTDRSTALGLLQQVCHSDMLIDKPTPLCKQDAWLAMSMT